MSRSPRIPTPPVLAVPVASDDELWASRIADIVLKAAQLAERTEHASTEDPVRRVDQRQRLSRLRDAIQAGRRGLQRLVDDGVAPDADGVAK